MTRAYQNLFAAGVLAISLSGCSIVVFEDGEDCKVTKKCLAVDMPKIETPDDLIEAASESDQPNNNQPLTKQVEESLLVQKPLMLAPLIDGYMTNFAYDSAEIGSQTADDLKVIANFLTNKPGITLIIEGHCDERGSRDYNLALGDRRAVAIRDILIANGMEKSQIKTISYGKERPLVVGSTPEVWARNRRAVIRQQIR